MPQYTFKHLRVMHYEMVLANGNLRYQVVAYCVETGLMAYHIVTVTPAQSFKNRRATQRYLFKESIKAWNDLPPPQALIQAGREI